MNFDKNIEQNFYLPPIDEIFNSVGKLRILNILSIKNELNITAISTKSGLNHSRVKDHIEELKELDLIHEKRFGRIKIYEINDTSIAGSRIKEFLKLWYLDSQ